MKYCDLHNDPSEEEGDGCPLCECMRGKERALINAGKQLRELRGILSDIISEATELLNDGEFGQVYFMGCLGDAVALRETIGKYKAKTPLGKKLTPDEYLKRPYTWCLIWDEESHTWTGKVAEFPGCVTQEDCAFWALGSLFQAALDWIAAALDLGQEIPEPERKP